MPDLARTQQYQTIARPGGGFAMVALDARESMRALFRDAGRPHEDDDLAAFKRLAARELGQAASAVLCDPGYGSGAIDTMRTEHPGTGLIVAVDRFEEPRYGPLHESRLDERAMDRVVADGGIAALKLYLFWRPDADPHARLEDARRFIDACRRLGVLALIEGVVTSTPDLAGFNDALVRAADEFGRLSPDLYKTQLPTLGRADDATIEREAARITDATGVPWVVLSNGVTDDRFPAAVAAACRGGASGVLAGRGVWRAALSAPDPVVELGAGGRKRLGRIIEVVDAHARPWMDAV
jgi:sulfofructosephosphate aldolase